MDPGNERDDQTGTGDSTEAWIPEVEQGWGAPAGSTEEPAPTRRRPVVRSTPGAMRRDRSPGRRDPAVGRPSDPYVGRTPDPYVGRTSDPEDGGGDRLVPPWPGSPQESGPGAGVRQTGDEPGYDAGAPDGYEIAAPGGYDTNWPDWQPGTNGWESTPGADAPPGAPPPGQDVTSVLPPIEAEEPPGAFYGTDPDYAPGTDDPSAAGHVPVGSPEVWGASAYDVESDYPLGGYEEPGSHIQPVLFPTDPDVDPAGQVRRRRRGVVAAAAVGVVVLLGGGVAAAVALGGPSGSPVTVSNTTSPTTSGSAAGGTSAGTTIPATASPTTASPTAAPGTPIALGTWTSQELNLILQVKTDLTNLNNDLDAQPDFTLLTVDATDLRQDLQAGQKASTPNDHSVAHAWRQLLDDLGTSNHYLDRAIDAHDANIARDLQAPVATTDTDYNNLSRALNATFRHADSSPSEGGSGQSSD